MIDDRRRCLNGHLEVGLRDSAPHEWKSAGANIHACGRVEFHGGAGDCFVSERMMSGQIPSREGGSVEKVGLHAGKKKLKDETPKKSYPLGHKRIVFWIERERERGGPLPSLGKGGEGVGRSVSTYLF